MPKLLSRAVALLAGLAMAVSITVGLSAPAEAASGCSITFTSYSKVTRGSTGAKAKAAQCLLRSAGYNVRADGTFSAYDATQLRKFQRAKRIAVTGSVTKRSWTALVSRGSRPTLSVGDSGNSVRRLQRSLTAAGRKVPATGRYGSLTKAAVQAFQRSRGWKATGTASGSVWRALQQGKLIAKSPAASSATTASRSGSKGQRAVAFAKRQLGDRYRFGANGPNAWDCSGLTQGAWKSAGVSLPHSARQQFRRGKKVSRSNLRAGDLVFFYSGISHVAIYVGNGKIIHASRPSKPVEYSKISYMPYQGARRVG